MFKLVVHMHIQHNMSSAISLSAYCYGVRRLGTTFGQCAVYVEAASIGETKDKLYACAWTRRSIHSRLSPPAGPAPALYFAHSRPVCDEKRDISHTRTHKNHLNDVIKMM